jgi:hypothetical protein
LVLEDLDIWSSFCLGLEWYWHDPHTSQHGLMDFEQARLSVKDLFLSRTHSNRTSL